MEMHAEHFSRLNFVDTCRNGRRRAPHSPIVGIDSYAVRLDLRQAVEHNQQEVQETYRTISHDLHRLALHVCQFSRRHAWQQRFK